MADHVRYSNSFTVRCQPEVTTLVERAALARGQKPTEYVRQAVLTGLRLDGFDPATIAPRDAGALCDSQEGRQRYALVEGDQIRHISYHDAKPDNGWLPVVHVDSEPFDLLRHWRLAPTYAVGPDKVVCTYPVVPKTLEHA